jgi:hypothetical protein
MNITSIYANNKDDVTLAIGKDTSPAPEFQAGEEIDGVITKVSDQISISFSGREVIVSKSTVQNATEGEIRKFKIMDVSNQSIVLKEVGKSTSNTSGKATWTNVETFKAAFNEYQAALEEKNQVDEEKAEKLKEVANRLTKKDYDELIKEGKYLDAFSLTQLDRALDRIKEQRQIEDESVKTQVEEKKEYKKEIIETGIKNKASQSSSEEISKKLEAANLPATSDNIKSVSKALELGQAAYSMSEKSMGYIIDNNLEPTVENIYKASYSTSSLKQSTVSKEDFETIKSQAEKVLKEAGITVDEESLKNAKWLFDNGLPINKESLNKLDNLLYIKQGMSDDKLMNSILTAMTNGLAATEASLDDTSIQLARQVVEDINKISDAAIMKTAESGRDITIQNLVKAEQELTANEQKTYVMNESVLETGEDLSEVDIKAITAKRQLEEIRLKLSVEAGQKLYNKGISVDTENLQNIVDELKQIEEKYYQSLLNESNAIDSTHNISLLKETGDKLSALKTMPSYLLGSTLSNKNSITISELHNEGQQLKSHLDKASTAYETLMTSPRKDLGDSIQKAFQNIDDILEDMHLEKTNANQRAVRILGYNSMDISEENIQKVKEYDLKVNTLLENMKPAVTVNLIKEGINPLDTSIDTLNALAEQVSEELGATDEEKYSEFLWKLEKQQEITEEERKTYIGVYRLLNNIEKSDGAAIGSVMNTNQDMTLNNLLTAVRTMKVNGVDKKIDDSFGILESLTFKAETITDQLSKTFHEDSQTAKEKYQSNLVKNILNEITPSKIAEVSNEQDIMNMSLEKLKEMLEGAKDSEEVKNLYNDEQVEAFRNLAVDNEEAVLFLKDNRLSVTMEYMKASKEFIDNNSTFYKNIVKKASTYDEGIANNLLSEMEGIIDSLGDKESLQEQYQKVDEKVKDILKRDLEKSTISAKDIKELQTLSNGMKLRTELSNKEYYQIPLAVNGSITNINLTVVKRNDEEGKISMKIESDKLGFIEADFTVRAGELKGFILCDNKESLNTLKNDTQEFVSMVENDDITVKQMDYGTTRHGSTSYIKSTSYNSKTNKENTNLRNEDISKTTTKQLYQIAKTFVLEIKKLENE